MWKVTVLLSTLTVIFVSGHPTNLDPRIVGGQDTTIEENPYQVSVRFYDMHVCGGAIIDENTVLTAAKCVASASVQSYSIMAGSTELKGPGQVRSIQKIIFHEQFDAETSDYNVAILKLNEPLVFSEKIQPIELQEQGVPILPATIAKISGWGSAKPNDYPTVNTLRLVQVDTISNEKCQRYYEGRYVITKSMMCSNNAGHDACGGDYGGPLVAYGKLAGLIGFSVGCGEHGNPRTYANISEMHDWIVSHK